ncbi:MAG: ammonium transporter, partial [Abitibacteriaceae bacterium]|nr:ammonium transporter [Abditibacteriaceae bacterium]
CGQYGAAGQMGADNSTKVTGLFYHGGMNQLIAQFIGSAAVTITTFAVAMAMMYLVKLTGTLRVSEHGEIEGIDLHEHGAHAYPEFPTHSAGREHYAASADELLARGTALKPETVSSSA